MECRNIPLVSFGYLLIVVCLPCPSRSRLVWRNQSRSERLRGCITGSEEHRPILPIVSRSLAPLTRRGHKAAQPQVGDDVAVVFVVVSDVQNQNRQRRLLVPIRKSDPRRALEHPSCRTLNHSTRKMLAARRPAHSWSVAPSRCPWFEDSSVLCAAAQNMNCVDATWATISPKLRTAAVGLNA